jgi:hypothetical protein
MMVGEKPKEKRARQYGCVLPLSGIALVHQHQPTTSTEIGGLLRFINQMDY